MTRPIALYRKCTDTMDALEHGMQDHCWGCAPFWDKYPVCPTHNIKLNSSGYCSGCKSYYDVSEVNQ